MLANGPVDTHASDLGRIVFIVLEKQLNWAHSRILFSSLISRSGWEHPVSTTRITINKIRRKVVMKDVRTHRLHTRPP